jgi:aminoglycoside 6-adenylyltransferase
MAGDQASEEVVLARIVAWARGNESVRAVLLEGSRGNRSSVFDEFSDYDIAIVVTDRAPFVESVDWAAWFGPILVHWGDHRVIDGITDDMWLVMYESGKRIDYCVWTPEELRVMVERGRVPAILDTGYRVLLDKDGLTTDLPPATHTAHIPSPPTEPEYLTPVNDFWWETLYVAKNLRRDELFPARWSFDAEMKFDMLRRMLEWRVAIDHGWALRPGNLGRGLKSRLPAERGQEIESTFVSAAPKENWDALWAMLSVFRKTAMEVGDALGYAYPSDLDARVTAYLRGLCPPEFGGAA